VLLAVAMVRGVRRHVGRGEVPARPPRVSGSWGTPVAAGRRGLNQRAGSTTESAARRTSGRGASVGDGVTPTAAAPRQPRRRLANRGGASPSAAAARPTATTDHPQRRDRPRRPTAATDRGDRPSAATRPTAATDRDDRGGRLARPTALAAIARARRADSVGHHEPAV